jgi:hypothetical protein
VARALLAHDREERSKRLQMSRFRPTPAATSDLRRIVGYIAGEANTTPATAPRRHAHGKKCSQVPS